MHQPEEFRTGSGAAIPALESPFNEMEEMELAAELLGVSSGGELDQFLSGLLRKAESAGQRGLKSAAAKTLGGLLKGAIKKTLPALGSAAGNLIAPGIGGHVGSRVASGASQLLGLELEGLSGEDQEFEAAKQLVRMGGAAAISAANAPGMLPPKEVAKKAVVQAAQEHAPGLLKPPSGRSHEGCRCHAKGGHWERRGNDIILQGL